jgi:hypothetical protein
MQIGEAGKLKQFNDHIGNQSRDRLICSMVPQPTMLSFASGCLSNYIVTCSTEGRRYYAVLLSLLGNRNISMDTLSTPVFLRCMVTNSWKASVSIVAGSVKEEKTIHAS